MGKSKRLIQLNTTGHVANAASKRLRSITAKKFRTCFIAALAEFENVFGEEVWGHNLSDEQVTTQQIVNRGKWEKVRKNILDKGNTQSRALEMEIGLHSVEFTGYRINFGEETNEK